MLHKRLLCTQTSTHMTTILNSGNIHKKWRIKQVTKSNFKQVLEEVKTHIFNSDFIAISLQKTGSFSAPWQRVLPFDTAETAYFKARRSADRFQVLQFAICPFKLSNAKLTAYPYNFHLFPRDELKIGMPSYSFSCQTSYLTSMARLGFDFNACIYDGISYVSRAQESTMKYLKGNTPLLAHPAQSSPASSVADSVFIERIKAQVKSWKSVFKDTAGRTEDPLMASLRKVVLGGEHGSRPSKDLDVCTERQVSLVLEALKEYSDDIVPLLIPAKRGGTQGVRVVLTSSKEDKALFEKELRDSEEEQSKQARGFREVIDMISASEKPIVAHSSLDDFAFIHSKFLSPLPPTIDEFRASLRSTFPEVIDLGHLMKEIGPLRRKKSLPAASSFLKTRFFAPVDIDIPLEGAPNEMNEGKIHGQDVISISHIFAKLCSILKHNHRQVSGGSNNTFALKNYTNTFHPCYGNALDGSDEDIEVSSGSTRKLNCGDLVFLWGFRAGSSARELKRQLSKYHKVFSEEFDVKLVDKSCVVVAFWQPGLSRVFLDDALSYGGTGHEGLREMMSEGIRVANYGTYKTVCEMGIWNSDLGDSLDHALRSTNEEIHLDDKCERSPYEIWWDDNTVINLDEL